MKKALLKIVKVGAWIVGINVIIFAGLVIVDLAKTPQRTADTVAAIHAQRLTMADVDGKHLPPAPDPQLVDATVEGIDANKNGIRDDVELAIFKKYPNDIKIRAAELQYAMELQNEFKNIFNKETWKVSAITEDRGYQCIGETYPRADLQKYLQVTGARNKEVEDWVFNTQDRQNRRGEIEKYTTSFSLPNSDFCDLDI